MIQITEMNAQYNPQWVAETTGLPLHPQRISSQFSSCDHFPHHLFISRTLPHFFYSPKRTRFFSPDFPDNDYFIPILSTSFNPNNRLKTKDINSTLHYSLIGSDRIGCPSSLSENTSLLVLLKSPCFNCDS